LDGDENHRELPTVAPGPHFRPRGISGTDLSRIISLSDGVFAFALTLLALSLTVPVFNTTNDSTHQVSGHLARLLQLDYNAFFGYGFAFVMIAIWWVVHHRTFQYIARYDSTLVWLNMGILLQIAVMPFVLSVFNDYGQTQTAVGLFAGLQVTLGITTTLLWDYARRAKLLHPNIPPEIAEFFTRRGWYTAGVFALSIGLTFVNITAAELSWLLLFAVQRALDRKGVEIPA
jgi:TMEM175 potassium channel family protein